MISRFTTRSLAVATLMMSAFPTMALAAEGEMQAEGGSFFLTLLKGIAILFGIVAVVYAWKASTVFGGKVGSAMRLFIGGIVFFAIDTFFYGYETVDMDMNKHYVFYIATIVVAVSFWGVAQLAPRKGPST